MKPQQLKTLLLVGQLFIALETRTLHAVEGPTSIIAEQGVAAGGDIRNNRIIINQYSRKELRQIFKEELHGVTSDKALQLSLELSVTQKALSGFLKSSIGKMCLQKSLRKP